MTDTATTSSADGAEPGAPALTQAQDDSALAAQRVIAAGDLGRTARSGILWTLGGQWSGFVLQTATTVVLARLLDPRAFGLLGMALTLTVFTDQFRAMGLSQAIVQQSRLTSRELNALFWVNTGAGVVFAVVVAALAPLLAYFYDEPKLVGITLGLSVTYVFAGLAAQPSALLARLMSFRALAVRGTAARLVSAVAAIGAALMGAGYWSLVVQQVALAVAMCAFVWVAVDWRPGPPRDLAAARSLVRFGAGFTLGELFNTLSRNGDNIIIGRFLGAAQLGLYTRAYGLLMLPIRQLKTPLGQAVQPMLAAVRDEPARYRRLFLGSISGLSHVGMPGLAVLAVSAPELIEVLLGRVWLPSATIFQFLAVAGIIQMVSATSGWLLITQSRAADYARMSLWTSTATVVSFVVGLPWGATGVAASYAVGQVLMAPYVFWYATAGSPVSLLDIWRAMLRPVVIAALVTAGMLGLLVVLPDWAPALRLLCLGGAGGLVWAGTLALWPQARQEIDLFRQGLRTRKRG